MKYLEIDFADGGGMCIKATKIPTLEEANIWLEKQVKVCGYGNVIRVDEISREEAERFYDFANEKNWKIFG